MTADDRRVLRDTELVELLANEPELLALIDAYAATQQRHWPHRRIGTRVLRLGLLAAATAAIAVPAAAFADQIGRLLGLSNSGTPVQSTVFPSRQVSALDRIGFPTGQVRLLAHRAGISFYAARSASGDYCFAVGFSPGATPSIDALDCPGQGLGQFPSSNDPVADFSRLDDHDGVIYVTNLAGITTDAVVAVSVEAPDGKTIYTAPVDRNVYAAIALPRMPAASIVALGRSGNVLFRRSLEAPPQPQPATP